jgi:biopolymer transport protein TolR
MASVASNTSIGHRGRKNFDAPINLIPYIDLMTTIVTFLMMSAVWSQLASLEAQNAMSGKENIENTILQNQIVPVFVMVTRHSIQIQEDEAPPYKLPLPKEEQASESLKDYFKLLNNKYGDKLEIKLQADDSVSYETLVQILDIIAYAQINLVTLTPNLQNFEGFENGSNFQNATPG